MMTAERGSIKVRSAATELYKLTLLRNRGIRLLEQAIVGSSRQGA